MFKAGGQKSVFLVCLIRVSPLLLEQLGLEI
jgi:hypothetical protein